MDPLSSRALRLVAVAAFAVAIIFFAQEVLLRLADDPSSVEELVKAGAQPANVWRARIMFAQFFLLLTVYAGIAAVTRRPLAWLGLGFGLISCILELAYRAVELVLVFPRWLPAYVHAGDDLARAIARARLELFYDGVDAVYFVLRYAGPLTALGFGLTLVGGSGRLRRAAGVAWLLNAARGLLRLFAPLWPGLLAVNGAVFLYIVPPIYLVVGAWLWRDAATRAPTAPGAARS
jgi:hypothetical protein